jgi:hypothetical protein
VDKKGSIEVRRILGPHLSEATILEDDVSQPVMAGDIIYSPIFEKGRPVHFALGGPMDVDGDGKDDFDLVRSLIQLNGGAIDAEVDAMGKRTGEISMDTTYVIIGGSITEKTGSTLQIELTRLQTEGSKAGATIISLDRFLNSVGYVSPAQTTGMRKVIPAVP